MQISKLNKMLLSSDKRVKNKQRILTDWLNEKERAEKELRDEVVNEQKENIRIKGLIEQHDKSI